MSGRWGGALMGLIVLGSQAIAGEPDDVRDLIAKRRSIRQVDPSVIAIDVDLSYLRTHLPLIRGATQNKVTEEPKNPWPMTSRSRRTPCSNFSRRLPESSSSFMTASMP